MSASGEKLDNFMMSILSDAEKESGMIMEEIRQKREASKEVAEDEILSETFRHIKAQVGSIKTEAGRRVSKKVLDNKRTLYARREEIMSKVFVQVKDRVGTFVAGPEYPEQLSRLARRAAESLGGQKIIFYLRPQDMRFEDIVRRAAEGIECEVREGAFYLGGVIAECPEKHLRADESFDTAFDNTRQNFAEILSFNFNTDAHT